MDPQHPPQLREAEAILASVADVTVAGLPLAAGLRAAAAESPRRRLANELRYVAGELEHGSSLADVLLPSQGRWAGYVGGLIRAGMRSGKLGEVLVEVVDQQRRLQALRQAMLSALVYPAVLVGLTLLVAVFVQVVSVGSIVGMFTEFRLKVPYMTQVLVWMYDSGVVWLLEGTGALALGLLVGGLIAGPARCRRAWATVPLVGAMWHWSGVAEFTRLLGFLVEQEIPLDEALQLAADGVHDADLRQAGGSLASGVRAGRSLAEVLAATHRFPNSLQPILGWGERSGHLGEACRTASEMFEGRVQLRSELLKSILPPLILVWVGTMVLVVLVGFYWPMLSLIQGLS